jgi:hypothetical protein
MRVLKIVALVEINDERDPSLRQPFAQDDSKSTYAVLEGIGRAEFVQLV